MGFRLILRATKRKYKRYSGVVSPVNESTRFSSFELLYAKPPKRYAFAGSSSHVLVPEAQNTLCSSSLTRNVSFPWLQLLSTNDQLSPSPTLLADLALLLGMQNYNVVLRTISHGGGKYPKKLCPYIHFTVGYSYFKLDRFMEAREHISKCKLNATLEEDVALCFLYLGKIASALQSHHKAVQHFRKAVVHFKKAGTNCRDSSIAKTFHLEQISLSSLHLLSSYALCQAGRFFDALRDSTKAVQFAKTDDEQMKAHLECGQLYQHMGNHASALDEFDQAIEHAQKCGDSATIQQACKDSCDSYIALEEYDNALLFFEKALSCDIHSTDASVPSIHHLEWICRVVALPTISVIQATERIPSACITTLLDHPKLTSDQFRDELERRWFSLHSHRLPVNDTVADSSNAGPVVCEEEGHSQFPINIFATFSPIEEEALMQPAVAPFLEVVDIPHYSYLYDIDNGANIGPMNHEHNIDTNVGSDFLPFQYFHDPYFNADQ